MRNQKEIQNKIEELLGRPGMLSDPGDGNEFPNVHDEPHESWEHTKAITILRWVLNDDEN